MTSSVTNRIDFLTPIIYTKPATFYKKSVNLAEDYLAFSSHRAFVISSERLEAQCTPHTTPLFLTACKILSFITLVLPLLALGIKLHHRYFHRYTISQAPQPTAPSHFKLKKLRTYLNNTECSSLRKEDCAETADIINMLTYLRNRNFLNHPERYFVVQRYTVDKNLDSTFTLHSKSTPLRKIPTNMRGPHPTQGGLCLVIHHENHFTALFADFERKLLVYYDPLNTEIDTKIKNGIATVKKTIFAKPEELRELQLTPKHQHDGYNCGRYVIHFLKEMMESNNPEETIRTLQQNTYSTQWLEEHMNQWLKELQASQ